LRLLKELRKRGGVGVGVGVGVSEMTEVRGRRERRSALANGQLKL
jgi:hypothetical protein